MLCPAGKKCVRTGAVELGKVLTPQSRLLHVVPGGQEAGENRSNGTGQGAYPREPPPPCVPSSKEACETGAMELDKVLTPESCFLHVVPMQQARGW